MLERLIERESRPSDLTYVEPGSRKGLSSHYDNGVDEKMIGGNHLKTSKAAPPARGLAAQSVATKTQAHTSVRADAGRGTGHQRDETGRNIAGKPHAELGRPA